MVAGTGRRGKALVGVLGGDCGAGAAGGRGAIKAGAKLWEWVGG